MSDDDLCHRCRKISFRSLFQGSGYHFDYSRAETELGTLRRIWLEQSCHFCELVKYTFETHYGKNSVEEILRSNAAPTVHMYWGPLDEAHDGYERSTHDIPYYVDFGISNLSNEEFIRFRAEGLARTNRTRIDSNPQMVAFRDNDDGELNQTNLIHFGKTVEPDKIDWSTIKDWISSCSLKHLGNISATVDHNPQERDAQLKLRVMDVSQACVVTLPRGAQYIALSYVWGKDQALKLRKGNIASLSAAGCFKNGRFCPSRTIMDAIQVVQHLGYRYLWVDALCIVQDDSEDIQKNVERMCQIYSEALLTIVAAAGTDADYGLPGLSPECPRYPRQKRVTIRGFTMANRLYSNINFTYWNKRGWTYQERVLSPRFLAFTPSHITYQCDQGCSRDEQFHNGHDGARFTAIDIASELDFENNNIFDVYASAVSEYTKRSITNPMDKVKAFKGVLDLLQQPFKGPFFFGLPISIFDVGLLWIPVGRCRRGNKNFPSWSWAGWDGAVAYDYIETDTLMNLCECTISQCSIKTRETDIHLSYSSVPETDNIASIRDQNKWTRHFDNDTSEIYYRLSENENQSYRYPRPLSDLGQAASHLLSKEPTSILSIQGRVAKFRLTGQHSGASSIAPSCEKGHHGQCNLAILDKEDRVAGRVLVDAHAIPQLQNREHKFLALSRSTLSYNDEDVSWDEESKTFKSWVDSPIFNNDDIQRTAYEEYYRPFTNWIAEVSPETEGDYPISSELETKIDRSNIFRMDYDGPQENRGPFDARYFSNKVFWPILNVLLLSEEENGVMERCGIGQVHIDAFRGNDKDEDVLLG